MGCRFSTEANSLLKLDFPVENSHEAIQYMLDVIRGKNFSPSANNKFDIVQFKQFLLDVGIDVEKKCILTLERFLNR